MDLFTPEEIEEFTKQILAGDSEEEFMQFYAACAEKARANAKFQWSMFSDKVMAILALVVEPLWGKVEMPTDKQIALISLTDAACHEIFDRMVDQLTDKAKTDTPN